MHVLVLTNPERTRSKEIVLGAERVTIGSGEGNLIRLRGEGVADRQCCITPLRDGRFKLVDEQTVEGTNVNGDYVAQKLLEPGDTILCGRYLITYKITAAAPPAAAAPLPVRDAISKPAPTGPSQAASARARAAASRGPEASQSSSSFERSDSLVREEESAGDAEFDSAERSARGRRKKGWKAPMVALSLSVIGLIVVAEFLPSMLRQEAFGGSYSADRLATARVFEEAGDLDRARKILLQLQVEAPGSEVDHPLRRVESVAARVEQASERLDHLARGPLLSPAEKRRYASEVLAEFRDVPVLGDKVAAAIRNLELEAQIEEFGASDPIEETAQLSEEFVAIGDFAGAIALWAKLSQSGLLVDEMVRAAAEENVEVAADHAAEVLLALAEKQIERGDLIGALLTLDGSVVKEFHGTRAFDRLEALGTMADELASGTRAGGLVGAIPPRRTSRDEPDEPTIDGMPSTSSDRADSTPKKPPTEKPSLADATKPPVAHPVEPPPTELQKDPRTVDPSIAGASDAQTVGDSLFQGGDLSGSVIAYQRGLELARSGADRTAFSRRIERSQRARWFLEGVRNYIEADLERVRSATVLTREGERLGKVVGVSGDDLVAEVGADVRQLPLEAISSQTWQLLARSYPLTSEDHLNRSFYLLIDGSRAELDAAFMKANEEASLKAGLDSAIAFSRGEEEIPDWGYFRHDNQWMTFREREYTENLVTMRDALKRLDKVDPGDAEFEEVMSALRDLIPVAGAELVPILQRRRSDLIGKIAAMPEAGGAEKLMATRVELEARRKHALELIYDTERYFYPYKDRPSEYNEVQVEVDARVARVRDLWGNEHAEAPGGTPLSKKFNHLRTRIEREGELLAIADKENFDPNDPILKRIALLPRENRLTIRNIAIDALERSRLDRDVEVLIYNAKSKTSAQANELDQILITNRYRLMMGSQAVAVHDLLCKAARGHAEWMTKTGIFSHFNEQDPALRTPADRIAAQGYLTGGSGENIAQNSSASGSHYAWIHSSGHHRNLLLASHTELGVGAVGIHWVQNFAGGRDFTGNLGNL